MGYTLPYLFSFCFLSLLLGADEQHGAIVGDGGLDEVVGDIDQIQRLEQVDDVDSVTLGKDVLLHLRVPTAGLVTELETGLQHFAHSDLSHGITTFLVGYCLAMRSCVQLPLQGCRPTQAVAGMTRIHVHR